MADQYAAGYYNQQYSQAGYGQGGAADQNWNQGWSQEGDPNAAAYEQQYDPNGQYAYGQLQQYGANGAGYDPNQQQYAENGEENADGYTSAPPAPDAYPEQSRPDLVDQEGADETNRPLLTAGLNFDETDNEKTLIRDADGRPKACSFAQLIVLITHPKEPDANVLIDFVLTYRSFATSFEVLDALVKRYDSAAHGTTDQKIITSIWLRVLNVLRHWLDKAWYDFKKDCPELSTKCAAFLDHIMETNPAMKKAAEQIKGKMNKLVSGDEDKSVRTQMKTPKPYFPKDGPDTQITDIHPEEIARQLTLLEWGVWESIQPWECLGLAWMKKDKARRAPNVLLMIERFNYVSGWIATLICQQENLKKRGKFIHKFIEVADRLRTMNNFNGVMEIISGLNRGPVFRLKQSWEEVPSSARKLFEELRVLTSREKNYANMRKQLKKVNPPCIPYLGIYLTDLTFVEEGNQDMLQGLINFNKRHLVSELIRSIQQYQLKPYAFETVQYIQDKLRRGRVFDEDTLYEVSEWLEPRPGKEKGPKPLALGGPVAKKGAKAAEPDVEFKTELEFQRGYPFYATDAPSIILYDSQNPGVVKAGTVAKLIERLTHHANPDTNSLQAFLATFRAFSTPHDLFELLAARYSMPSPKDKTPELLAQFKEKFQTPIYLRVFNVVKDWVTKHSYDFEADPALRKSLVDFVNGPLSQHSPGFAKAIKPMVEKLEAGQSLSTTPMDGTPPPPKLPAPQVLVNISNASILDFDSEELARQLTILVHRIFHQVRPNEWLNQNYQGDKRAQAAPAIVAWNSLNSVLRTWADNELNHPLVVADTLHRLPLVVQKLIEVADFCYQLNNFDSLRTIMHTLNRNGVQFVDTISPAHKKMLQEKDQLLADRDMLRERLLSVMPPCVPPLDSCIADVYRCEERFGKNMLTDKLVNFEKWRNVGDVVVRIMSQQRTPYTLSDVASIQEYLTMPRAPATVRVMGGNASFGSEDLGAGAAGIAALARTSSASTSGTSTLSSVVLDVVKEQFSADVKRLVLDAFSRNAPLMRDRLRVALQRGVQSAAEQRAVAEAKGQKKQMKASVSPGAIEAMAIPPTVTSPVMNMPGRTESRAPAPVPGAFKLPPVGVQLPAAAAPVPGPAPEDTFASPRGGYGSPRLGHNEPAAVEQSDAQHQQQPQMPAGAMRMPGMPPSGAFKLPPPGSLKARPSIAPPMMATAEPAPESAPEMATSPPPAGFKLPAPGPGAFKLPPPGQTMPPMPGAGKMSVPMMIPPPDVLSPPLSHAAPEPASEAPNRPTPGGLKLPPPGSMKMGFGRPPSPHQEAAAEEPQPEPAGFTSPPPGGAFKLPAVGPGMHRPSRAPAPMGLPPPAPSTQEIVSETQPPAGMMSPPMGGAFKLPSMGSNPKLPMPSSQQLNTSGDNAAPPEEHSPPLGRPMPSGPKVGMLPPASHLADMGPNGVRRMSAAPPKKMPPGVPAGGPGKLPPPRQTLSDESSEQAPAQPEPVAPPQDMMRRPSMAPPPAGFKLPAAGPGKLPPPRQTLAADAETPDGSAGGETDVSSNRPAPPQAGFKLPAAMPGPGGLKKAPAPMPGGPIPGPAPGKSPMHQRVPSDNPEGAKSQPALGSPGKFPAPLNRSPSMPNVDSNNAEAPTPDAGRPIPGAFKLPGPGVRPLNSSAPAGRPGMPPVPGMGPQTPPVSRPNPGGPAPGPSPSPAPPGPAASPLSPPTAAAQPRPPGTGFVSASAVKQSGVQNLMAQLKAKAPSGVPVGGPPPMPGMPAAPEPQADSFDAAASAVLARDFPNCPVTEWSYTDVTGELFGAPNTTHSLKVVRTRQADYICDIQPSVQVADVGVLLRMGKAYKAQNPTQALACVIITRDIASDAQDAASRYKIKTYTV